MGFNNLMGIVNPAKLRTFGEDWHQHTFKPYKYDVHLGDRHIQDVLKKVFDVRRFDYIESITCWYDVMTVPGDEKSDQVWDGVYMMGVFYKHDADGDPRLTHFFLRKMEGYRGSLDTWKNDLAYPADTREYSVCAILPKGYVLSSRQIRDPHNDAVAQYTWERLEEMGVKLDEIIACITDEKFKTEAP